MIKLKRKCFYIVFFLIINFYVSGFFIDNTFAKKKFLYNEKKSIQYLLLVTFYTKKNFAEINHQWIEDIGKTPYDGIAVMTKAPYRFMEKMDVENDALINELKICKKDIWPWVFFNQFIGGDDIDIKKKKYMSESEWKKFQNIPGMDIYDQTGAMTIFKNLFRISLKIAKNNNSPGIVIDPEAYNNKKVYRVKYLAKLLKKSPNDIKKQLNIVGKELANIIKDEYPEVIIWFLTLKPTLTTSMIAEGILDEAFEQDIPLKILEGGEHELGYIHWDIKELERKINKHGKTFSPWLKKYGQHFALGGTISPTDKPENRSSFIKQGYKNSGVNSVQDLKPIFSKLFTEYKYVWIYAASASKFNPFDTKFSEPYHKIIGETLKTIRKEGAD